MGQDEAPNRPQLIPVERSHDAPADDLLDGIGHFVDDQTSGVSIAQHPIPPLSVDVHLKGIGGRGWAVNQGGKADHPDKVLCRQ